MIPAPFLPGCPSALDRAAWLVVSQSGIGAVHWPLTRLAFVLYFIPALAVTGAALWAWRTPRANVRAAVFPATLAAHPPLALSVAPLLLGRESHSPLERGRTRLVWLRAALVIGGALAILLWATPLCKVHRGADVWAIVRAVAETMRLAAGPIVLMLAALETLRRPGARETRVGWSVFLAACTAVFLFQDFDGRLTLIPAAATLWWLAARAAWWLIVRSASIAGRVGAALLVVLVPVLQTATVLAAQPSSDRSVQPAAGDIFHALDAMWTHAGIVAEDAAHDLAVSLWRSQASSRASTLQFVDVQDPRIGENVAARPTYAFARGARRLIERGIWAGPIDLPTSRGNSVLWRALVAAGCETLSSEWRDVTDVGATGQVSARFSHGGAGPHVVLYAVVPREGAITRVGWSDAANTGYLAMGFDLTDPASRRLLDETAASDALPLSLLPTGADFVAKLRIEHVERTGGALLVTFDVP